MNGLPDGCAGRRKQDIEMISADAITFDIDWAPDWCIRECRDICARLGVSATFFATHESAMVDELLSDERFEVGIHPNLLPNSDHGSEPAEVLDHILAIVPDARSTWSHALVQSTPLLALIADEYPQIDTDTSLLLPFHPNLQPVDSYFGTAQRRVVRLPYYWEDDVMAEWPGWTWTQSAPFSSGLRIFNFHPTLVALNIDRLAPYTALKRKLGHRRLYDAREQDFDGLVNTGYGDRNFLEGLIKQLGSPKFRKISEVSKAYRSAEPPAGAIRTI